MSLLNASELGQGKHPRFSVCPLEGSQGENAVNGSWFQPPA